MKYLVLALFISTCSFAQNQNVALKAGTTYSHIEDIDQDFTIGYFLGVGIQDKLTSVMGFSGEINYTNQRSTINDISASVQSMNVQFTFNIYPTDRFYLIAGLESGIVTSLKIDGENGDSNKEPRFGFVAGAAAHLSDRFELIARYLGAIDDQQMGYNFNTQLGLNYKIPTGR